MKKISSACMAILASSITVAQTPTAAPPASGTAETPSARSAPVPPARGPSLELALEAARTALETCTTKGFNVGVSVIDSGGVLKVLLANDGASPRGILSSTNKAVTAVTFAAATSQLAERIKTDTDLAQKVAANASYNARAGGVLLKVNDEVIGAIGVGGARGSENDEACALVGIEKIQGRLR